MVEISNEEYHSNKSLGASLLKEVLMNAKKFKKLWDKELKIEGKQLDIGSALHKIVLEPESFYDEFAVAPVVNKRTKAGKEEWENFIKENEGKVVLSAEDMQLVESMKSKIMELPKIDEWLEVGVAEKSFFTEIDGVGVKCRPDLLVKTKKGYIVIDLKTMSGEATPDNFAKTSGNFLYYLQEAVYREVLKRNGLNVIKFIFLGVSKVEHSGAEYFEHDITALELGEELLKKALFKFKWCLKYDEWEEGQFDYKNGGFEVINTITLPNYVFYQF